jgi:PIN domain nuclease of toxin-antitoxin system
VLLLLDTHVLIWIVEGDTRRVGRRTRTLVARAEASDAIRVSPVSLFELTALHTLGRLRLTQPPDVWIDQALAAGVRVAELTRRTAVEAAGIGRDALADPLDRLLVATARGLEATFLTGDHRILNYAAAAQVFRVHDASR